MSRLRICCIEPALTAANDRWDRPAHSTSCLLFLAHHTDSVLRVCHNSSSFVYSIIDRASQQQCHSKLCSLLLCSADCHQKLGDSNSHTLHAARIGVCAVDAGVRPEGVQVRPPHMLQGPTVCGWSERHYYCQRSMLHLQKIDAYSDGRTSDRNEAKFIDISNSATKFAPSCVNPCSFSSSSSNKLKFGAIRAWCLQARAEPHCWH